MIPDKKSFIIPLTTRKYRFPIAPMTADPDPRLVPLTIPIISDKIEWQKKVVPFIKKWGL